MKLFADQVPSNVQCVLFLKSTAIVNNNHRAARVTDIESSIRRWRRHVCGRLELELLPVRCRLLRNCSAGIITCANNRRAARQLVTAQLLDEYLNNLRGPWLASDLGLCPLGDAIAWRNYEPAESKQNNWNISSQSSSPSSSSVQVVYFPLRLATVAWWCLWWWVMQRTPVVDDYDGWRTIWRCIATWMLFFCCFEAAQSKSAVSGINQMWLVINGVGTVVATNAP